MATRGSVIYFVLADLAAVEVMYQFSLAWFQDIFDSCLMDTKLDHQNKTNDESLNRDDTPTRAGAAVAASNREEAGDVNSDLRLRLQAMIDRSVCSESFILYHAIKMFYCNMFSSVVIQHNIM